MFKIVTIMAAIALTVSAIAFSVAADAKGPTERNGQPLTAAGTTDCDNAVWPHYGEGCLFTINGVPSDRTFRTVGS